MTCINEVNGWYDFIDLQMTKIIALVLWFFHITMHSPFKFVYCSDERIAGCVLWFLSFALQQNHIPSLKVHFVIHSLIPILLQERWDFYISRNISCKFIWLAKQLAELSIYYVDIEIITIAAYATLRNSKTCITHKRNPRIGWKFVNKLILSISTELCQKNNMFRFTKWTFNL